MHLSRLTLTNFRNYSHLEWEPHPGNNILYGGNGQGKSNLLEAIYLLSTTRSHRATHEKELINWSAAQEDIPAARVEGEVSRRQGMLRLEMALMGRKGEAVSSSISSTPAPDQLTGLVQKKIRLNGIPRRATEVVGQMSVVLFTSHDIELIGGPPTLRRRYLDAVNMQIDNRYVHALLKYNRVLEQRNHLLRLIQEGSAGIDQLDFWNRQLIDNGSYIVRQRAVLIKKLNELAAPIHRKLTSGSEELHMTYLPNLEGIVPLAYDEAISQGFSAKLQKFQPREVAAGISLVGPHRDDLSFRINSTSVGTYGSRGQQRTLTLSMKLAEARFLLMQVGEPPIVLLDDVLSELDAGRRTLLLGALGEYGQVITTATELGPFEPTFISSAKPFEVKDGQVIPM